MPHPATGTPQPPSPPPAAGLRWLSRIAWFAALWLAGVAAVAAIAWMIRRALGL